MNFFRNLLADVAVPQKPFTGKITANHKHKCGNAKTKVFVCGHNFCHHIQGGGHGCVQWLLAS